MMDINPAYVQHLEEVLHRIADWQDFPPEMDAYHNKDKAINHMRYAARAALSREILATPVVYRYLETVR